eukprot:7081936-Ditylum_brightwellii.AAC.1
MEGITYATSLDLNMRYYHIKISPKSSVLCAIVLPWGKDKYLKCPMDIKEVCAYMDNLLLITHGDWDSHLQKLNKVLGRLKHAGLKVNAQKSCFGCQEFEHLGYWVTRQGIKLLQKS